MSSPAKIVIAHRGASGYLPEHTLPAYALAHGMGADYIEPDLVLTRDGHLICLHDIHLQATTNVEQVFSARARDDGRWYAADFTLAEIRRLEAEERLRDRFPRGRSRFAVPSFVEMIELVQGLNERTGRKVGIYPELKAPAFHRAEGLPMEEALLEVVERYGYRGSEAPIFVQSFEEESLRRLRELGSELPQVFLMAEVEQYRQFLSVEGIRGVAKFADGIGPAKTMLERQPELIGWAHDAGLTVHPYTFRADQVPDRHGSHEAELERYLFELGVDGVFTDYPDRARAVLDRH
ncbi:MAG: glycerophosphodiester phosphodiesterase [Holophagales bacterium]|nr:glycerophosphodiester phosphodiesterase [Holophagales bacterium]MYF96849.1 glycerophosphodiester phosphodiesterase [Holophagales bacterium]